VSVVCSIVKQARNRQLRTDDETLTLSLVLTHAQRLSCVRISSVETKLAEVKQGELLGSLSVKA
jgi:hypothetical protein